MHAMDTEAIIDRLGGPAKTARICGLNVGSVLRWKRVGVPAWHYQALVDHAARNGIPDITYDTIQAAKSAGRKHI